MRAKTLLFIILFGILSYDVLPQNQKGPFQLESFGEGGQIKMLYDRRQRPPSVLIEGKIYIVFNGGGEKGASAKSPTRPMAVVYDIESQKFSHTVSLGPAKKDHHYGPIIWVDGDKKLHVLYGCHSSPGTHLISKKPLDIGKNLNDWTVGSQIAPKLSYPTAYSVLDGQQIIYYRTEGHTSSWTYRLSKDNGQTWMGPKQSVTDLDSKGRFEWSSYQTKLISKDRRYLHIAFTAYDDNKAHDPERYYNPRYKKVVSNEWKYNLYYIRIDLKTQEVSNFQGEKMKTPIDLDQANAKCRIWDTEGRGAGVPPDIVLDENQNPAFLHVLSEETTEHHSYYFVKWENNQWQKRRIAPSNHQWNSCHISLDENGTYHAYLIVGNTYVDTKWVEGKAIGHEFEKGKTDYLNTGGYMDKHGGGRVEEWISTDQGNTWQKHQELTPDIDTYPNWKYNNTQPVTRADGTIVQNMLLFYGWKNKDSPEGKGFLLRKK